MEPLTRQYGTTWAYITLHRQVGMRMFQLKLAKLFIIRFTVVNMGASGTTISMGLGIFRGEVSAAFIIWEKNP
jgi:hypothetical protein